MNSLQALRKIHVDQIIVGHLQGAGVNLVAIPRLTLVDSQSTWTKLNGKSNNLSLAEPSPDDKKSADLKPAVNSQEMIACMALIADKRDRAAFMKVYGYFAPRVKSFLVGRGLNQATADDVLQEAMLAVWEKAHSFNPDKAGVSTWIFTIARYKYIDRLRRDGRQKTESDEPDLRASDTLVSDDEVLQQQRQDAVQAAIAKLPEDQKSVIFLSFIKGLAHSEIAEQQGLPLGTVKSRIRRAFGRLREELGELL
ncbi:MAG: sigma-70 family RNA polymerase sigma factor [Gammaproteobacteria bacterium]|nr:sigma-70 family RNA polymerase sigma factor [Gammaproteobacteria bacterium]MCP4089267.1 sigma-70 family RNA polymerase sigma factor [Gammaproteobacteria bacterium]MCP4275309.1 sigma-70 family RNA polymerase sigma factor [Gammaproteobacteria bacterium]MCP4830907.1 sigma-70 family RNA polymerase sigma factor [Gammaproteobacteria bacterium]MCP4929518.1 sigma-70 family RNA polymerase sigma factor [Gammaproteobacteria bacterium]